MISGNAASRLFGPWRLPVVAAAAVLVAVALTFSSSSVARADTCFTQGYDFSRGYHDYYTSSHECLGSAAPWWFFHASGWPWGYIQPWWGWNQSMSPWWNNQVLYPTSYWNWNNPRNTGRVCINAWGGSYFC